MTSYSKTKKRDYKLSNYLTTTQKDDDYYKNMGEFYIRQLDGTTKNRTELQVLYDAAQGVLDTTDYNYVVNPHNTMNAQYQRFPAKLRNYDIIKPIINTWLGKLSKRYFGANVVVGNSDAQTKRKDALNEKMSKIVAQDFVNNLNNMGVQTGVPSQEIPPYDKAKQEFEENYDDKRARFGQQALDYIKHSVAFDEKVLQMFYDFCVTGLVYTYKGVRSNDVEYDVIDPREITVIGKGNSLYDEDAEAVIRQMQTTGVEVFQMFHKEILEHPEKEAIIHYLDQAMFQDATFSNFSTFLPNGLNTRSRSSEDNSFNPKGNITLFHACWNTFSKHYILHYYDEFGAAREMFVNDVYKLDKANGDIKLEELLVREWHEVYRIDNKFYLAGTQGAVQRHKINNLASCKLPYNGTMYGYRQSQLDSKVKQLIPFQVLYNIMHYRWELLMAKNKEKIMALPLGMIPNGKGWDADKFFYYMEALGFMVYDETAQNAMAFIQGIKSIDMSMGSALESHWRNMEAIKQEAWDLVNHNRQQAGEVYASDGKGTTEAAIGQSENGSAPMFFQLDKLLERDYQGLLDCSKPAYSTGKKGYYINSEGKTAWFDLSKEEDIIDFCEADFNVFAKNSAEEQEKRDKAESLVLTMGQNGLPADAMIEVFDANNMASLKALIKKGMAAEREFQQSLEAQKAETVKAQTDALTAIQDGKNATAIEVAKISANAKIQQAGISAEASKEIDTLDSLMEDTANMDATANIQNAQSNLAKRETNASKNVAQEQNMQLAREKNSTALQVAKENKNKYDK
jgi:hypothetical protein